MLSTYNFEAQYQQSPLPYRQGRRPMTGTATNTDIAANLAAISTCSRAELVESWRTAHGSPPPKGISRRLLAYDAAYRAQARVFGGLKPAIRRQLAKLAGSGNKMAEMSTMQPKSARLTPGARLVREWHGQVHTVDVLDEGFLYDGEVFASLSKIANTITGTRWSGPRFFGLGHFNGELSFIATQIPGGRSVDEISIFRGLAQMSQRILGLCKSVLPQAVGKRSYRT